VPPVDGAVLAVCKSGANAGRTYWAVNNNDKYGNSRLAFFEWIERDENDLSQVVRRVESKLDALIERKTFNNTVEDND